MSAVKIENEFADTKAFSSAVVPKLSADNFPLWKDKFHNLMIKLGLHEAYDKPIANFRLVREKLARELHDEVDAELAAYMIVPIGTSVSSVSVLPGTLQTSVINVPNNNVKKLFAQMNKAWSLIMDALTLDMREQVKLLDDGYPHAVMVYLRSIYENNDLVNIGDLWMKYFSMKMVEDELFDKYHSRLEECKSRLLAVNNKVEDDLHKMLIVDRLPDRFGLVVLTIKTTVMDKQLKTVDWMCKLINDYERELNRKLLDSSATDQVFWTGANSKSSGSTGSKITGKGPTCFYCKKHGHVQYMCAVRTAALEKEGKCGKCGMTNHQTNQHVNGYITNKGTGKPTTTNTETALSAVDIEYMFSTINSLPLVAVSPIPDDPTGKHKLLRGDGTAVKAMLKTNATYPKSVPKLIKTTAQIISEGGWGIDSSASVHITGNKQLIRGLRSTVEVGITLGDGTVVKTNQAGHVVIPMESINGKVFNVTIENVYWNERFTVNLLSLSSWLI
jgi:hypothetical protein